MFGYIKKLFRTRDAHQTPAAPAQQPAAEDGLAPAHVVTTQSAPAPDHVFAVGESVQMPLNVLIASMPQALLNRIAQAELNGVAVAVPLQKILPQLPRGSVKISFGELRQWTPLGVFSRDNDQDSVTVELPLKEILARLNPALLTRRPNQRQVEVSAEVTGPFGDKGQGIQFVTHPAKMQPVEQPKCEPASAPDLPVTPRFVISQVGQPAATPEPIRMPASRPQKGAIRITLPTSPCKTTTSNSNGNGHHAAPANGNGIGNGHQPPGVSGQEVLEVVLGELTERWPEALRQEISEMNLIGAQVRLPLDLVEKGLKRGKVLFSWKLIRSWIKPPLTTPVVSAHDATLLELALKTVAPLYLGRKQAVRAQRKVVPPDHIPDLFFNADTIKQGLSTEPMTVADPEQTPKPVETNYYIWGDDEDRPMDTEIVRRRQPAAASDTDRLKRLPSPNEIVRRATVMEGVEGALITLPDGLVVASQLPDVVRAETIGAFLPQIFGRVSQATKELRMGELNNVNFTVGNTPWKIFRVGSMFFAAFGRKGGQMPSAQLVELAAELDRKPR